MGKRPNTLREYHLLVIRNPGGFSWEVRYGRNAKSVRACNEVYRTQEEASRHGQVALDVVKEECKANTAVN